MVKTYVEYGQRMKKKKKKENKWNWAKNLTIVIKSFFPGVECTTIFSKKSYHIDFLKKKKV